MEIAFQQNYFPAPSPLVEESAVEETGEGGSQKPVRQLGLGLGSFSVVVIVGSEATPLALKAGVERTVGSGAEGRGLAEPACLVAAPVPQPLRASSLSRTERTGAVEQPVAAVERQSTQSSASAELAVKPQSEVARPTSGTGGTAVTVVVAAVAVVARAQRPSGA